MGTPIDHKEIRKGDRVREITRITSHRDYTADMDGNTLNRYGNGDKSWELLDRPRKVIHAKGTTLYLKHAHLGAKKGDPVTVIEDFYEDQYSVRCIQADGYKDGYPYEYWLTTEKPRVLKWAKGTRLWFKDDASNRACDYEGGYTVGNDVYEDNLYVDGAYFVSRFTDEKPEPHPVGAIRWVTEDNTSAYGHQFKKGERFEVRDQKGNKCAYPAFDRLVGPVGLSNAWYINSAFLSETLVEPAPTIVAVPLPAIEKLRDAENWSAKEDAIHTRLGNANRRNAINNFLDTREVKTALREDDRW